MDAGYSSKWVLRALWPLDVVDQEKEEFLRYALIGGGGFASLNIGRPQSVDLEGDEHLIPVFADKDFHALVMKGHCQEFGDTRFRGLKLDSLDGVVMGYLSSETIECESDDEDGFWDFLRARMNATEPLEATLECSSGGFSLRIHCDLPHKIAGEMG